MNQYEIILKLESYLTNLINSIRCDNRIPSADLFACNKVSTETIALLKDKHNKWILTDADLSYVVKTVSESTEALINALKSKYY